MEELGGYRGLGPGARVLGTAAFLAALGATALLERFQFQLRATEQKSWWASNGRDVINVVALGVMSAGLWVLGFTGPVAFCLAGAMVILLTAAQLSFAKLRHETSLTLALAVVLGAPIMLAPRATDHFLRRALEVLFQ